jgi:glutaconate CoA-transferase subunit B
VTDSDPVSEARAAANAVIWSLASKVRSGDVVVVGVATPLAAAAALLGRELVAPDLTVIMAAAVDPDTHDIAESLRDPAAVARRSEGVMAQLEILDLIARGEVSLQFISPAEVDSRGAVNTMRVLDGEGRERRLPGPLALPDVSVLVGRLVAYRVDHSRRFLPERVHYVTGAGDEIDRSALPGAGVRAIVTGLADIAVGPDQPGPTLTARAPNATGAQIAAVTGFALAGTDGAPAREPIPDEAVELLDRVIDPDGVRLLETRAGRQVALAALGSG